MDTGTVVGINNRRGMFAVQMDSGDYAVFELLDSIDLAMHDKIRGDLEALGSETLHHLGHAEDFEAYGQSGSCSIEHARRLLA